MTLFKICGLRDAANALVAAESGAALLGFVFVEGVRRQLAPQEAERIIAQYRRSVRASTLDTPSASRPDGRSWQPPKVVGLFANQSAEFISDVASRCDLDYAQLCGDEPPAFWHRLDLPIIRKVEVREDVPRQKSVELAIRQVSEALEAGHSAVLDKRQAGAFGGTGRTFDWNIARDVASECRVTLAGGLDPLNVGEAIRAVSPWCVDVSTGVETDGVKDPAKIAAFASAVAAAT